MIKVLKPGFYSTIQDLGRFGHRAIGVPVSGAMDNYSSRFANTVLGNNSNAAVLEITMTGPTLEFQTPTQITISGANISPMLNAVSVEMNTIIHIKANDILSFGKLKSGFRAYLAVKGGFLQELILGSKSMYKGITDAEKITKGDTLNYHLYDNKSQNLNSKIKYDASVLNANMLEVMKGPEFDELSTQEQKNLLKGDYLISKLNSRMAYQLEPLIKNNLKPILTSPVLPGTVQLTPSGQLIVLMRDCQTTGGYPRVLQLTEESLNKMSQKLAGNIIKIRLKE